MRREGDKLFLEKADIIRMNQLILRQTNYRDFLAWYESLDADAQATLIGGLCQYAYQAGVNETVYQVASQDAALDRDERFLSMMKKVRGDSGLNIGGLIEWLRSVNTHDRARAFKLFVYLFGEAERRVRQTEDRKTCNHWWHRNLEDPRIVECILSDPEYYKTTPNDDEPKK